MSFGEWVFRWTWSYWFESAVSFTETQRQNLRLDKRGHCDSEGYSDISYKDRLYRLQNTLFLCSGVFKPSSSSYQIENASTKGSATLGGSLSACRIENPGGLQSSRTGFRHPDLVPSRSFFIIALTHPWFLSNLEFWSAGWAMGGAKIAASTSLRVLRTFLTPSEMLSPSFGWSLGILSLCSSYVWVSRPS